MPRQARSTSSGQAKSPSLAKDLLALGDIYLTLGWLAYQRLRHGPLWPWETRSNGMTSPVVTLTGPKVEGAEESPETVRPKRG